MRKMMKRERVRAIPRRYVLENMDIHGGRMGSVEGSIGGRTEKMREEDEVDQTGD